MIVIHNLYINNNRSYNNINKNNNKNNKLYMKKNN